MHDGRPPSTPSAYDPAYSAKRLRALSGAFIAKTLVVVLIGITAIALAVYLSTDIQRRAEQQVESEARNQDELLAFLAAQQINAILDERRHHLQILALSLERSEPFDPYAVIRQYTSEEFVADDFVSILDARGTVIASTEPSMVGTDASHSTAFNRARLSTGIDACSAIEERFALGKERSYALVFAIPIRPEGATLPEKFVEVTIYIPSLVGNLVGNAQNQHVTMIAADGTILFHSRVPDSVSAKIASPPPRCFSCHESLAFAHAMQDKRTGSLLHAERGRKEQAFAFSTVDFNGSQILLVLSHDEVAGAFMSKSRTDTLLLILVVLGVSVITAIIIIRANRERAQAAADAREWKKKRDLEAALRAAEQHYRTIVESSHDLIWMVDPEARFTFMNQRVEQTLGFAQGELIGRDIREIAVGCDPIFAAILDGTTEVGSAESEVRLRTSDERVVILEVASVVVDTEGARRIICSARDVTSRREAEATLRRTQRDYLALVDSIPGIVWRADAKTVEFDFVSEQAREILGYDPKKWLQGSFWVDHLHPDDREWAPRFCAEQSKAGLKHAFEYRMIAADGSIVWLHDVVDVRMENGEPKTISGVMIDITPTKTSQIRLRESEERFRAIFEQSSLGITLRDANGMIIDVNPAIPALLGYTVEELRSFPGSALAHPDEKEFIVSVFRDLWTGSGQTRQFQWRYRRKDGTYLWARVTLSLIRDSEDRPMMSVTLLEDISEQLNATRERTRLATAIEHAGEAVVVTDAKGRIEYVNPAFESITGYSRHEATGKSPAILKSGRHDEAFYDAMWAQITSGETWAGRIVNKRKDDRLYEAEATISPMFNESGQISGFVAVQRDVTEHVALLQKLHRAEEMHTLGRLVGGVAHEVRNPLGAIQAALGALELDLGDVPAHAPFFSIIRSQVDRLSRLMRELLELGKPLQESRVAVHSLAEICESSIAAWRHSNPGEPPSRIALSCKPGDARARIDPSRMQQVVINLIDNAMQHSSRDTTIVVSVEESGDACRIRVRDAGSGIEGAVVSRIFDPFFTTRKGGTGLGLSLVRNIVEQHSGRISVFNNDHLPGATAEVILPLARACEEAAV